MRPSFRDRHPYRLQVFVEPPKPGVPGSSCWGEAPLGASCVDCAHFRSERASPTPSFCVKRDLFGYRKSLGGKPPDKFGCSDWEPPPLSFWERVSHQWQKILASLRV